MNSESCVCHLKTRRHFLAATSAGLGWLLLPRALRGAKAGAPTSNPVAHVKLAWTDEIKWASVVDLTQAPGKDILDKLASAQAQLAARGGGVVYFPPGVYRITDSIQLKDGIVLRGADPLPVTRAQDENSAPPSRLEFPQYIFKAEGSGTPTNPAFKGIHLENPAAASNCGAVNLDLNRGHVFFEEAAYHSCGRNRLVYGCQLRNAALPNPNVPGLEMGQKPWQRYTATWERAAIRVTANRTNEPFPCRKVQILNNAVSGRGILISGSPAENNVVKGNRVLGTTAQKIKNEANAVVESNEGFEADNTPWMSPQERGRARE